MRYFVSGVGFLACFVGLLGCTADPSGQDGPQIAQVAPDPVAPGEAISIEGGGFGESGHVAVGGRALQVISWTPSLILAELSAGHPPGPTRLVVTTAGQPSASVPLRVSGAVRQQDDPPRRFPPSRDAGPDDRDQGVRDMSPFDDGVRDFDPPDLGDRILRAEFVSDPVADGAVFMEADTSTDGELLIRVRTPPAWGIAFHLDYDRNLLRLRSATPADEPTAHTAEIGPGRTAAGQALRGGGEHVFELRFALVGRGEGRITFPARYRTRRDGSNQALPTSGSDGSLRLREVAE
jgi:hypothetical protein